MRAAKNYTLINNTTRTILSMSIRDHLPLYLMHLGDFKTWLTEVSLNSGTLWLCDEIPNLLINYLTLILVLRPLEIWAFIFFKFLIIKWASICVMNSVQFISICYQSSISSSSPTELHSNSSYLQGVVKPPKGEG